MSLEGELRIGLRVSDGRIDRIGVNSTRPDVARMLLQGRSRAEVVAAVPQLFSICGHSQGVAAALACAAAAGETASAEGLAIAAASVAAEMVREYAWRALLEAPHEIGEGATDDAVAAARASLSLAFTATDGPHPGDAAQSVAIAAFGVGAEEWLTLQTLAELDLWATTGSTATARLLHRLRHEEDAASRLAATDEAGATPLLAAGHHAAWIDELAAACVADPEFARLPCWRGAPAETGALARLQSDPLISGFGSQPASRVTARHAARLRELALLLAGRGAPAIGAKTLPDGGGIAWIENARGLLIHRAQLHDDQVRSYTIVAPTEWNFHPGGAIASALLGRAATDLDAVLHHATRVVRSLDPCVACHVELDHA